MLHGMNVSGIVKAIDDRIAVLTQAKILLDATAVSSVEKHVKEAVAANRPRSTKVAKPEPVRGRKPMSVEGRARIVAAQKKRWALQRATAKKAAKNAGPPAPVAGKKSVAKKAAKQARKASSKNGPSDAGTGRSERQS